MESPQQTIALVGESIKMENSPETITLISESDKLENSQQTITLVSDSGKMEYSTQDVTFVNEVSRNQINPLATSSPRLTPTGKISYAKTRVYTQRYRKEWEQMSDFKGWLTSVPFQPTRAYCRYCKKNLHAHRLSLLKHTCTMKHQRSTLAYVLEEKQLQKSETDADGDGDGDGDNDGDGDGDADAYAYVDADADADVDADANADTELEVGLMEEVETLDESSQLKLDEDNEDDIEYVVERLDTDEDETLEFKDIKDKIEKHMKEDEEKEMDTNQSGDSSTVIKKMKLSHEQKCRDPLAEAMAHVHSEYLEEEEVGDQENIQMEMVVESTNDNLSVPPESSNEKMSKTHENEKTVIKATKNGKVLQEDSKDNLVVTSSIPVLNTTYQTNISANTAPSENVINLVSAPNAINYVPNIANMKTQKTITLMCGNKTFTLTGGAFQPGTQFVLTKLKGKPTTLMVADQKKTNEPQKIKLEPTMIRTTFNSSIDQSVTSPSTSEQSSIIDQQSNIKSSKKAVILGKQPIAKQTLSKKLRISTYVVDTVKGTPINGLQVSLYKLMDGKWTFLNETNTNSEGHCNDLVEKVKGTIGRYKIHFDVDKYFTLKKIDTMFPFIEIVFDVKNSNTHYHIPLLLSPFGYTTYRGT